VIRRAVRLALGALGVATAGLAAVVAAEVALDHRWRVRRTRVSLPARATSVPQRGLTPLLPPVAESPAPPCAPRRRPRAFAPLRLAALALGWAGAGAALTLLGALAVSFAFGYRSMTVMSGSMAPAIETGDVVVNRPIAPGDARVGDVVTFREPGSGERFITHRVRRITRRGGRVTFITKGDANTGTERWTIAGSGEIGRVDFRLPGLGYALFWTSGRYAIIALVTVPVLLLGVMTVVRIWRPREKVARGVPA
jgi:signal peptidase